MRRKHVQVLSIAMLAPLSFVGCATFTGNATLGSNSSILAIEDTRTIDNKTIAMNANCPSSTPALNEKSESARFPRGSRISLRMVEKPNP